MKIDLNPQFKKALEAMEETGKNIFITGRAGTGKSTLLQYFRERTKKKIVVLAPTGVAALNVQGQTIHSFFRFKPDVTLESVRKNGKTERSDLIQKLDAIVIDEISMVRADLLDCVDLFLRLNGKNKQAPFGGIQMIFIGDLYQLPPVVTSHERDIFKTHYQSPYFFSANCLERVGLEIIELEKIYRQRDAKFIHILNAIRTNTLQKEHLAHLNKRVDPSFQYKGGDFYITLATTNDLADTINEEHLQKIKKPLRVYTAIRYGSFEERALPTHEILRLKVGSQVMMLNNDSAVRWVNGSIGKIVAIRKEKDEDDCVVVQLTNGKEVDVTPYVWEMFDVGWNAQSKSIVSETIGTFRQYPMRLAWAVTIHKSQGKTFDNVIIDLGRGAFAHGQTYVALSRCRTLEGIVLRQQISSKHILTDWQVAKFMTEYRYAESEKLLSLADKIAMIEDAITSEQALKIVYLKSNDEKSERVIIPHQVGEMEYLGKCYIGVDAYCCERKSERVFRVDRILQMKAVDAISYQHTHI